jgi:hypothetical protein
MGYNCNWIPDGLRFFVPNSELKPCGPFLDFTGAKDGRHQNPDRTTAGTRAVGRSDTQSGASGTGPRETSWPSAGMAFRFQEAGPSGWKQKQSQREWNDQADCSLGGASPRPSASGGGCPPPERAGERSAAICRVNIPRALLESPVGPPPPLAESPGGLLRSREGRSPAGFQSTRG